MNMTEKCKSYTTPRNVHKTFSPILNKENDENRSMEKLRHKSQADVSIPSEIDKEFRKTAEKQTLFEMYES